jgi:hypothetical protein
MAESFVSVGNFEDAFSAYEQAIVLTPGNVTLHRGLRDAGVRCKAAGGRPAGLLARWKAWRATDPTTSLVRWEHLLARDPGNTDLMAKVFHAAKRAELPEVVNWIAEILQAAHYK